MMSHTLLLGLYEDLMVILFYFFFFGFSKQCFFV